MRRKPAVRDAGAMASGVDDGRARGREKGPGTAAWTALWTSAQLADPANRYRRAVGAAGNLPGHAGIRAMADAVSGGLRRQATVQIDACIPGAPL